MLLRDLPILSMKGCRSGPLKSEQDKVSLSDTVNQSMKTRFWNIVTVVTIACMAAATWIPGKHAMPCCVVPAHDLNMHSGVHGRGLLSVVLVQQLVYLRR